MPNPRHSASFAAGSSRRPLGRDRIVRQRHEREARLTERGGSDPTLLARARAGDRVAFATLVDGYYPRALRFATQLLGDAHDAEEAVQDCWVRVHDALPRFIADAPFDPWFFRILANRCRSAQAKRGRFRAVIEVGNLPADAATPAATIVDEWSGEVRRALARLPAEQREAFLLRHVEELEYEEIVAATGVGLSAVRMRVKRACDALRTMLDEAMTHG